MTQSTSVFRWVPAEEGIIPFDAMQAGQEADGRPLYIGRVYDLSKLLIGSVAVHLNGAVVAINGEEKHFSQYDVLCTSDPDKLCWVECTFDDELQKEWQDNNMFSNGMHFGLPQNWLIVQPSHISADDTICIGRSWFRGALRIGSVFTTERKGIVFGVNGQQFYSKEFAVLAVR
ncbi:hypothetical protein BDF19DRAFT_428379 [Syncephalis fuscata]|nr:hypothetical protein BDF19DRAFT_428379 [Syncephalis fuscata]